MDVSQEEKELRWLDAAKALEQSLLFESYSASVAAEHWQKIGDCYSLASRQVGDIDGFKKLSLLSVEAYKKAADLYADNKGKQSACLCSAQFTRSWLAPSASEKSILLDECRGFGDKALVEFQNVGEDLNYGKTAHTLLLCFYERCTISPTLDEKRN